MGQGDMSSTAKLAELGVDDDATALAEGQAGKPGAGTHEGYEKRRLLHGEDLRWRMQEAEGLVGSIPSQHAALVRALTEGVRRNRNHVDLSGNVTQRQLDSLVRARSVDSILASMPRSPPYGRALQLAYGGDDMPFYVRQMLPYVGLVATLTRVVETAHREARMRDPNQPRSRLEYLDLRCAKFTRREATLDDDEWLRQAQVAAEDLLERALSLYVTRAEARGRNERKVAEHGAVPAPAASGSRLKNAAKVWAR